MADRVQAPSFPEYEPAEQGLLAAWLRNIEQVDGRLDGWSNSASSSGA